MQGCVEIVYITVQTILFIMVVYWMCSFQIDAGMRPHPAAISAAYMPEQSAHPSTAAVWSDVACQLSVKCLTALSSMLPVHCSPHIKMHSLLG